MFYFRFVKRVLVDNPNKKDSDAIWIDKCYHYTARFYTSTDFGEFTLYGFNGSDEDVVVWVNENNYQKVFVMNSEGKTIDVVHATHRDLEAYQEVRGGLQEVK